MKNIAQIDQEVINLALKKIVENVKYERKK